VARAGLRPAATNRALRGLLERSLQIELRVLRALADRLAPTTLQESFELGERA